MRANPFPLQLSQKMKKTPLDVFLIRAILDVVDNYVFDCGSLLPLFFSFFQTVFSRYYPFLLSESHPFQNQVFTKCKFRKSLPLILIRIARGFPPKERNIRKEHHEPVPRKTPASPFSRNRPASRSTIAPVVSIATPTVKRCSQPHFGLCPHHFQPDQTHRFPSSCITMRKTLPPTSLPQLSELSPAIDVRQFSRPPPYSGHKGRVSPRRASVSSLTHHLSSSTFTPAIIPGDNSALE